MMFGSVIDVKCASKRYDNHAVLNNCNMTVTQGTIFSLMGSSGCGKTTLLSCIIGTKTLDGGSIKVFGNAVGSQKSMIGCMPQNDSLIEEFTIKELIFFFGTIYGLGQRKMKSRFKFLSNLLELPDGGTLIKHCSGGQRRRISFAICLVHEPKLLILDEPTVGLDPLLRHKIWEFLKTITSNGSTTVVLTTHYIEEAKQANCVGLLRKGVLIAEDSPLNLLDELETDSLESTFLKLCLKQDSLESYESPYAKIKVEDTTDFLADLTDEKSTLSLKASEKFSKVKALTKKNFIQAIRQPFSLGFLLITPFLCLMSFYLTIGGDPIGLKIGIVNDEVKSFSECDDPLLKMTTIDEDTCRVNKISCRFINNIDERMAEKIFYESFEKAYEDAKRGAISGVIHFESNFTSAMKPLLDISELMRNYSSDGEIDIFLDQSDRQITFFLQQHIYSTFEAFLEELMEDCGRERRVGSIPMQMNAMFGSFKDESRRSMTPGVVISLYFFLASTLTATAFISDRLDGIWNRVLLAGVVPVEFLAAHVITNTAIMILQSFEFVIVSKYIYELENRGSSLLVLSMIFLVGISAILYGLAVSILAKDFTTATFASSLIFFPIMIMCGIFWPLEAIPWYFRYVAYCMPFSLPAVALRNILFKGLTLAHPSVQLGFTVITLWIPFSLVLCIFGLRSKKFCAS